MRAHAIQLTVCHAIEILFGHSQDTVSSIIPTGYWQSADETAKVMLPGGWFRTGDIGRMDENGFFYIEDR